MRIWFVNHHAVSPMQAGGTRHHILGRYLTQRGHEVTVIASSIDKYIRKEIHLVTGQVWKLEDVEGVKFVWIRTPPYRRHPLARVWNMVAFATRFMVHARAGAFGRPDIVIGSSPHLVAAWAAAQVARQYQVPFVLEVRDLWPQTLVDFGVWSAGHPFVRVLERIERYLYSRADRILLIPPEAAGYLIQKGARRGKIVWLPNGADLDMQLPPELPRNGQVFTIVYAGAHGVANSLDSVLDTAAILQREGWKERVRFRLVGDGPEKVRLQCRAVREGLETVVFEPPVPKNQMYRLLKEADAFILPLKDSPVFQWGISPQKLFDYLASARPVLLAANLPRDPVSTARAGFTAHPGDPQTIAGAVKQLALTPLVERWEMGQRGRKYVEEHHNWSHLANKLEDVLLSVVDHPSL